MLRKSLYALLVALLVSVAPAAAFAAEQAPLQVCFTPGGDCTDLVVGEIAAVRAVRDEYVDTGRPPASTLVEVSGLFRDDVLIEIEAVAIRE